MIILIVNDEPMSKVPLQAIGAADLIIHEGVVVKARNQD